MFIDQGGNQIDIDLFSSRSGGFNFFTHEMLLSHMSKGAKVFIVDVGHSHKKICDIVKASKGAGIGLNPFATNLSAWHLQSPRAQKKPTYKRICNEKLHRSSC